MPEELLHELIEGLTMMAVMLSAKNPLVPTEEELDRSSTYAIEKMAEIMEEWKEANGGRRIPIYVNHEGDDKDDE